MKISQISLREDVSPQGLELGVSRGKALAFSPFQEVGVGNDVRGTPTYAMVVEISLISMHFLLLN